MSVSLEHVVVLAPGPIETDGKFADIQNGVYLGGQVRLEAAARLARDEPSVDLTLVGGYNKVGEGEWHTSKKVTDMSRFILSRAPKARVHSVFSLPCTWHNFVAVLNRWVQDGVEIEEVGVLTNAYHLSRALECAQRVSAEVRYNRSVRFTPLAAEDVLDTTVEQLVRENQEAYLARLAIEERGLAQLRSETYVDGCLTSNFKRLQPVLARRALSLLTDSELDEYQRRERT